MSIFVVVLFPFIVALLLGSTSEVFTFSKTYARPATFQLGVYAVFLVISFIGYISVWFSNKLWNLIYAFYYLLVILLTFATTIVFFCAKSLAKDQITMLYSSPIYFKDAIEYMEGNLTCCGYQGAAENICNTSQYNSTTCDIAAPTRYKAPVIVLQLGNVVSLLVLIARLAHLIYSIFKDNSLNSATSQEGSVIHQIINIQ